VRPNTFRTSKSPATFKHEDDTVQVPTALPPQGVNASHEAPVVPAVPVLAPELPPAPTLPAAELLPPAELPPEPPPELVELQATIAKADATAGRKQHWSFINGSFQKGASIGAAYAVTREPQFRPHCF
jgi:hypothetical protein